MHSCIYEGTVSHHRLKPVAHQFRYRLFMVYLDLSELPSLVGPGGAIADKTFSSRSFLRNDHLFDTHTTLDAEVRDIILKRTGQESRGPIRLLTQLRYFGIYFSPLNLFYVFDESESRVEFIVAEVSNTPWNEKHCYVLWEGNAAGNSDSLCFSHKKQFHVSPFMGMDQQYRWRLTPPEDRLSVQLVNVEGPSALHTARMDLSRQPLGRAPLRAMTLRYPLMTAQVSAAIYYQALKLWWKRCPYYPHPNPKKPAHQRFHIPGVRPRRTPGPARGDQLHTYGNASSIPLACVEEPYSTDLPSSSTAN